MLVWCGGVGGVGNRHCCVLCPLLCWVEGMVDATTHRVFFAVAARLWHSSTALTHEYVALRDAFLAEHRRPEVAIHGPTGGPR